MKRKFALLIVAMIALSVARAGNSKVEAVIARDKDTRPATAFGADVPKLYAFFRSDGTKKGDSFRSVWIAEDAGDAAPKETKIFESSLTADEDNFSGTFSLSKPTKGWRLGKYRLDIYAGNDLATSVNFTMKEKADADDEDDDEDSAD